ncbi:MAG: SUMF1/EgtB/PvdO family nonheme iron enzyme, partial [bacterium]
MSLTTVGGTANLANGFTYVAAPTITNVNPAAGPVIGGTLITVTGTNLTGTTSVTVGGVAATSVTVTSATTLTAVTPAGTTGAKNVVVTTVGGSATAAGAFTYLVYPTWATVLEPLPDPAVVTNATLRSAIIASGYPWRVRDDGTQIEMVLIPAGSFSMGCSASNASACGSDETPVHSVQLTNPFYLGRYEVTQAQWQAKMGSNPSYFQSATAEVLAAQVPNRPVELVSWTTAQGFLTATSMRLPTEAEWEYAYRAGTTTAFHGFTGNLTGTNDDTLVPSIGWYAANSVNQTRPVGGKAGNGLGLHDMAGNVYEWVSDWYSSNYYVSSPASNPAGPASGTNRVLRGGSWFNTTPYFLRSSFRTSTTPDFSTNYFGIRVARAPSDSPPSLTGVSPNSGSISGGTEITITGANLAGTTSVTVGGVAATGVTVVNSTSITAITPAGNVGARDVIVTTSGGVGSLTGGFTYFAAPSATSVSPTSGPTTGGTTITITGANLTGTTSVRVGNIACTNVTVVNATTVTAVTPAADVGVQAVSVTTPGGTANLWGGYTYVVVNVPAWATLLEVAPDPAIVTDATLRNAITATGYPWRVRDNGTNIEMVLIPPGTFNMGCSASSCGSDESPVHSVTLTNAFYLGRYEVTQAQWTAKMGSNPSSFQSASVQVPAA